MPIVTFANPLDRSHAIAARRRIAALSALGVGLLAGGYSPMVAHGATAYGPQFTANLTLPNSAYVTEPSIRVSAQNDTYVDGPVGIPAGCQFYQVAADGASATSLGLSDASAGGGDCDLATGAQPPAAGAKDIVALSSLTLANVTASTTTDQGHHFLVNALGQQIPDVDREWNAAGAVNKPNEFYLSVRQVGTSALIFAKSEDGGLTYVQSGLPIVTPTSANHMGNMAVSPDGQSIYMIYTAAASATAVASSGVWIAASTDGGANWTESLIHDGSGVKETYSNDFPSIAMDAAGTLYAIYTDTKKVHFATSSQANATASTWAEQIVPQIDGVSTTLFPWIAAGPAGQADLVWLGTPDSTEMPTSPWNVYFARYTNAANPVVSRVSDHVMHYGFICEFGLSCSSGPDPGKADDRALGDFFQVADGPDGVAHVVFSDNGATPSLVRVTVAQEIPGTTQTAPVAATATIPASSNDCHSAFVSPAGDAKNDTRLITANAAGQEVPPAGGAFGDGADVPNLDVISGTIGQTDAGHLTTRVQVKNLNTTQPNGNSTSLVWRFYFSIGSTAYYTQATLPRGATTPTYLLSGGTGSVTGTFNQGPAGTIDIVVPLAGLGNPASGAVISSIYAEGRIGQSVTTPVASRGVVFQSDRGPGGPGSAGFGKDYTLGGTCALPAPGTTASATFVTGVGPADGVAAGGTPISVVGSGFQPGANLFIDGVAATNVTLVGSGAITGLTPAHAPGVVGLLVANPDGSSDSLPAAYTYNAPPPSGGPGCVAFADPRGDAIDNFPGIGANVGTGNNMDNLDITNIDFGHTVGDANPNNFSVKMTVNNLSTSTPTYANGLQWWVQWDYKDGGGNTVHYIAVAETPAQDLVSTYDFWIGTNNPTTGSITIHQTTGAAIEGANGTLTINVPVADLDQNTIITPPAAGTALTNLGASTYTFQGANYAPPSSIPVVGGTGQGSGFTNLVDAAAPGDSSSTYLVGSTCPLP